MIALHHMIEDNMPGQTINGRVMKEPQTKQNNLRRSVPRLSQANSPVPQNTKLGGTTRNTNTRRAMSMEFDMTDVTKKPDRTETN